MRYSCKNLSDYSTKAASQSHATEATSHATEGLDNPPSLHSGASLIIPCICA